MSKTLLVLTALFAATCAAGVSRVSPFGIVEGITDCGSAGRLGTVQVTDCTLTPCQFYPGSIYDISIRFTASRTSTYLALHLIKADDDTRIMEVPINGEIQAGIEYELTFQLPITDQFSGQSFDIKFYILDMENLYVEICAQAAAKIH